MWLISNLQKGAGYTSWYTIYTGLRKIINYKYTICTGFLSISLTFQIGPQKLNFHSKYLDSSLLELWVCWHGDVLESSSVPCFSSTAFPKLFLLVIDLGTLSLAGLWPLLVASPTWLCTATHTVHFSLANDFVTFKIAVISNCNGTVTGQNG